MSRSHLPPDTNVVEIWGKFLFGVDCHNLLFIFSVSLPARRSYGLQGRHAIGRPAFGGKAGLIVEV